MKFLTISICLLVINLCNAQLTNQTNTAGLLYTEPDKVSEGLVLFGPEHSSKTYLIDNCGLLVKHWTFETPGGQSGSFLLPDGSVIRIVRENAEERQSIISGCLERRSWDNELIWRFCSSNLSFGMHGDLQYLPNGNFLVLGFETFSAEQSINAGIDPTIISNSYYSEAILELKPVGINDAEIVWQWRKWDHLVQDVDSTKANYGNIKTNFRKIDANLNGIVNHFNGIDYNATLNQILISNWSDNEIYIIDHTTTTEEASSSKGGQYNFGGDFLFRWGSPQNYGFEKEPQLLGQHCPVWIPDSYSKFGGKLSLFNNRYGELLEESTSKSAVFILDIDPNNDGIYELGNDGTFLPEKPNYVWTGSYKETDIFSSVRSSAAVQRNGNLLISLGSGGNIMEIDTTGEVVWVYRSPDGNDGFANSLNTIFSQNDSYSTDIYKVEKYNMGYAPQLNNLLCGDTIIENKNDLSVNCKISNSPNLSFNFNSNNLTVNFTAQLKNETEIKWYFGDGNFSTETNPNHTYSNPDIYEVCLIAKNCYRTDTLCKNVSVQITNSVEFETESIYLYPNPAHNFIYINIKQPETKTYVIYDIAGKPIIKFTTNHNKIDVSNLLKGVYFIEIKNIKSSNRTMSKFTIL